MSQHTFLKSALPAKAKDAPVDIYTNGLPDRPFERVAMLDVHCESQFFADPNVVDDAIPLLKKEARAAGCDGVIEIQSRGPFSQGLETRTLHVTATGIVYK